MTAIKPIENLIKVETLFLLNKMTETTPPRELWTTAKNVVWNLSRVGMDELLQYASTYGYLSVVKYLVENGADVHAELDGALKTAARNGHLEVVEFLVENGANIHSTNDLALSLAAAGGHLDIVKYLGGKGADISPRALRLAVKNDHKDIVKYLKALRKIRDRGRIIRRKKNLQKRKESVSRADWQNYCAVISDNTNVAELRKISESVGLPIKNNDKNLTKRGLCAQLAIQMEAVLENSVSYEHPDCENLEEYEDLFDTDLTKVSGECLVKDNHKRCFYIGDIVDQNGEIRENMHRNPYNRENWNLSDVELKDMRKNCTLTHKVHQLHVHTTEDLQRQMVRDILIELDKTNHATNTDTLMDAGFELLDKLVTFFQEQVLTNPEYKQYTTKELKEIRDNIFEIDMLAKFLSITRNKMSDINLSEYLTQFLNEDS